MGNKVQGVIAIVWGGWAVTRWMNLPQAAAGAEAGYSAGKSAGMLCFAIALLAFGAYKLFKR
jgi:hypothetical protein